MGRLTRTCRSRPRRRRAAGGAWLAIAAALLAGCGKKGPPLAPLVRVPQPVVAIEARRVGPDVYVTFTVPAQNVDGVVPADVRRIDVLALTADAPPPSQRFVREGARVASIAVAPPPREVDPDQAAEGGGPPGQAVQGATVTIRDALAPEDLVPAAAAPEPAAPADAAADPPRPDSDARTPGAAAPASIGPQRFYTAVAISERGRSSAAGAVTAVPLEPAPARPAGPAVAYTAETLTLTWPAVPGVEGYHVYVQSGATPRAPSALPPSGAIAEPPAPANASRLVAAPFSEAVQFGVARCYRVASLATSGGATVESEPSEAACVTPVDTFAPPAPRELTAVALDGAVIELRWEPSPGADVAGYLVLRGMPDEAALTPLTATPVRETSFVDRDVIAGLRYIYAVVAADSADPPNLSPESERDDATARP